MKIVSNMAVCTLVLGLVLEVVAAGQTPTGPVLAKPGKLAPKPLYTDPVYGYPTDPVLCFNAEIDYTKGRTAS
jgi:hypothetical protein